MQAVGFEPRRILCPVDLSEHSSLALKYAAAGAREYGAQLTVLHAHHLDLPRYFNPSETLRLMEELSSQKEAARADLSSYVKQVLGDAAENLPIQYEVLDTHPLDAILDTAGHLAIDLIVLGTHGRSGVKRLLLGSVAENTFRNAKVPVFLVRQKEHEFIDVAHAAADPHLRKILCAVNLQEESGEGLRTAVSLAEHFHAGLTVLYALEPGEKMQESEAKQKLFDRISGSVTIDCSLEPLIRRGYPAEQIIAHAAEEKEDLVIVCARHRPFQKDTFFGRTTDLVVRNAPAPVLVVPLFPLEKGGGLG